MGIVVINDKDEVLREAILTSSERALDNFFRTCDGSVQAVVECTSYWYWVADWGGEQQILLALAHAKLFKVISYAKVKTDSVDHLTDHAIRWKFRILLKRIRNNVKIRWVNYMSLTMSSLKSLCPPNYLRCFPHNLVFVSTP